MPETSLTTAADAGYQPGVVSLPDPTKAGRKLTLTPELLNDMAALIAKGHYIVTACQALGVPRTNYYRWLRSGEADDAANNQSLEAAFWHTVKTAEAQGEIRVGELWLEGGKDWPAYATWNERKYPERWARRSEGNDGPKVVVQIGVKDSDVQVQITAVTEGNHNRPYQTQILGESEYNQSLTAPQISAIEAKVEGESAD